MSKVTNSTRHLYSWSEVTEKGAPSFFRARNNSAKRRSPTKQMEKRLAKNSGTGGLQQELASKILETVKSGQQCSLHGLAGEFNLSKSHLQHLFKRQTGLSLGHLLIEQKLKRAAFLLKSTNMRIKEIGYAVGYEHTPSFIRAFERRFAEAPRAYRRHSIAQNANK